MEWIQIMIMFLLKMLDVYKRQGMAIVGFGVWSLVWQQLSRQILNSLFLWIFCKWTVSYTHLIEREEKEETFFGVSSSCRPFFPAT